MASESGRGTVWSKHIIHVYKEITVKPSTEDKHMLKIIKALARGCTHVCASGAKLLPNMQKAY